MGQVGLFQNWSHILHLEYRGSYVIVRWLFGSLWSYLSEAALQRYTSGRGCQLIFWLTAEVPAKIKSWTATVAFLSSMILLKMVPIREEVSQWSREGPSASPSGTSSVGVLFSRIPGSHRLKAIFVNSIKQHYQWCLLRYSGSDVLKYLVLSITSYPG